VFLHKSADSLDLLTEAKLERRFRAAARNLTSLYCGYYVAELLDQMTDKHDPHPELFDAAVVALSGLDDGRDPAKCLLGFELTALRLLGHLPSLDACASCGRPREAEGRVSFGFDAGGVLCPTCRAGKRRVVSLSGPAWGALTQFAEAPLTDWQTLEIPEEVRGEVRGVMNQYLAHLLGKRPRMQEHLGMLGR
jgi:DNA repair protein RecO (recombination protein O)